MKILTKEEEKELSDIEKNFDDLIEKYRKEWEKKMKEDKKAVEQELKKLENYLEGVRYKCICDNPGHEIRRIQETLLGDNFCAAKINVLRKLLGKNKFVGYNYGFEISHKNHCQKPNCVFK